MRRARGRGNAPRFWFGASSVSIEHKGGEGYMVVQTQGMHEKRAQFLEFLSFFFFLGLLRRFFLS